MRRLPVMAAAIIAVVALGGAGFWYLEYQARRVTPQRPVLTPEAKAYVRNLQLIGVGMKAKQSYARQTVVEIVGNIGNNGDRALKSVSINCVFYDPYGQVVLRHLVAIVSSRMGGLKPGESKGFRLPFDSIPESWNQGMPQLVIAQILFE